MSDFQNKPGYGNLFNNRQAKQEAGADGANWPDVQGAACCPCCQQQIKIAGWQKPSKTEGKPPYLSLKLSEQDAQNDQDAPI